MKFFILFSAVFAQYEILGGQQFWKNLENEIKEGLNESMQFDDLKTEDHFHGILEAYQRKQVYFRHKINLLISIVYPIFKSIFGQFAKRRLSSRQPSSASSRVEDNCYLSAYLIRKKQSSHIASPFLITLSCNR